jgi:hypothetical protein
MSRNKPPQRLLENIDMQKNDKGYHKNTVAPERQEMADQVRRATELATRQQPYLQSGKVNLSFDGDGTQGAIEKGVAAALQMAEEQASSLSLEEAEKLHSIDIDMKLVPKFTIKTRVNKPIA